jgi:hypothetical protein
LGIFLANACNFSVCDGVFAWLGGWMKEMIYADGKGHPPLHEHDPRHSINSDRRNILHATKSQFFDSLAEFFLPVYFTKELRSITLEAI